MGRIKGQATRLITTRLYFTQGLVTGTLNVIVNG
jgi:hypothetical protein